MKGQGLDLISLKKSTPFMKQQFVVTHTVHKTEIPALLDSWVTNTPSVEL